MVLKSKVAVIPCDSYDQGKVSEAIEKGISLLGGWECFAGIEEKLLLKPNLLNRADVDKAVTTHPTVFEAVAKSLRKTGYEAIVYGDSPGHPGSVEKTAEFCGIKEVADRFNITLADFSHGKTVEYTRNRVTRKFELCQGVLDSDAIINLCKMKTHQLERITGAVKNIFGCVYGLNKGAAHAKYPDAESFAQMLVDLNLLLKARLHIMDAVVAMEGNGPASGNPIKMGLILISSDPVALDATFCRLVDLDPKLVPTVYYGQVFGLGQWKEEEIELLGIENLSDYGNPNFDVSREKTTHGKWAVFDKLKVLARKPVIVNSRCIRCGACVAACPVEEKAVFFPENRKESGKGKPVPIYDYRKCIRCYCCQEMCPEKAIVVKRKLL
ncbi:DUF362 domain-containing protein [Anoxybacterium hadale]|uniref:DUF362 domain-containing protein n=1 Tax=Anoxybacterium hadale TaxID=3408580 RepID=A0ACD1ABW1_9FIRM|nr:DUF362 domain-containing protein [Clostridiales bacterium]